MTKRNDSDKVPAAGAVVSATPRDARIVLRSRLYRLLAERKEYMARDLEDRLAATSPRLVPNVSGVDVESIEDATEIDRLCGAAVRILSRGWSAGIVEVFGWLDEERLAAVALALPESRRRAVLGRDLDWFRAFGTVDMEAVSEVETLIRDFDAMSRRHDDALRELWRRSRAVHRGRPPRTACSGVGS